MRNNSLVSRHINILHPIETGMKPGGQPREKIRALLFDIYGTLFISGSGDISIAKNESRHIKHVESLLRRYSITIPPRTLRNRLFALIEKHHNTLKNKGVEHPEVEIDRIWLDVLETGDIHEARKFAIEYEMIVNPVYPMPGLKEMLAACKDRHLVMGIISNAQFFTPYLFSWFLDADADTLGFHPDLLYYSYKFGRAKPSSVFFQLAGGQLDKMGIPPRSAVYLGNDMLNDMYPAQKAGFQTALFAGDKRSLRMRPDDPRCADISPDMIITELAQLTAHL